MTLTPKAEKKTVQWAIQHWKRHDTQAAWQPRFATLVAQAQGGTFDTKDGLPSNAWLVLPLFGTPPQPNQTYHSTHRIFKVESTRSRQHLCFRPRIGGLCVYYFHEGLPSGRVGMLDEFGDSFSYSPKKTKGVAPKGAQQVRLPCFLDRSWVTVVGWAMADGVRGPSTFVLPNSVSWPGDLTSQQVGDPRFVGTDNGWVDKETFFR